jgi:CRISPR-associated exonuclease Cas4
MHHITGTLIWYYYICKREVWLMAKELHPYQEDEFLEIGRLIHENTYLRERKEILFNHMKIDLIRKRGNNYIVAEIKKSSKFLFPAQMQLLFYLYRLKNMGIDLRGELLIPKERKREEIQLTQEKEEEIRRAIEEIKMLIKEEKPPCAHKIKFCRRCAYNEFCWAEIE